MNAEQIIKSKTGTIVDVRTIEEYQGGHVAGSRNIPLHEIPRRVDDLKSFAQPLVLCCASGGRSGQAFLFLKEQGIDCVNGGSWLDVNFIISQL